MLKILGDKNIFSTFVSFKNKKRRTAYRNIITLFKKNREKRILCKKNESKKLIMDNKKLDDQYLIKQFLGGNKQALDLLINRHKNQVYSYILLIVKNRDLAEDIFQDTFIKVIKSLYSDKYIESGKFVSWVMRIAHNLIIDFYRKSKKLRTIAEDDTEYSLFNTAKFSDITNEQVLINQQVNKDLKALIKKLPTEQFEIIKLRYYFDMSFKEISERTGVSINTALGRMRYALINLRKLMAEQKVDLAIA